MLPSLLIYASSPASPGRPLACHTVDTCMPRQTSVTGSSCGTRTSARRHTTQTSRHLLTNQGCCSADKPLPFAVYPPSNMFIWFGPALTGGSVLGLDRARSSCFFASSMVVAFVTMRSIAVPERISAPVFLERPMTWDLVVRYQHHVPCSRTGRYPRHGSGSVISWS